MEFGLKNGLSVENCGRGVDYLAVTRKAIEDGDKKALEAYQGIKAVLSQKKEEFELEYSCHSPEEKHWFKLKAGCCEHGAIIIHEEITKQKLYIQSLGRNKEWFKHLTEALDASVWKYNIGESQLDYISPQVKALTGFAPEKCKGLDFWTNRIHPEDRNTIERQKSDYIKNGLDYDLEYRFRTKDHGMIWLQDIVKVETENGKPVFAKGVFIDITERKLYEEGLNEVIKKLDQEFERAEMLYHSILPEELPQTEELEMAAYYRPAYRLGGDFYDFYDYRETKKQIVFYISDVSGHDLSSSMVNIFLKEAVNNFLRNQNFFSREKESILNPRELINFVGESFKELNLPPEYYITLLVGTIDTENNKMKICNAGIHSLPILLRNDDFMKLKKSGLPIFSMEKIDFEYEEVTINLQPGEMFFAYTDGLIEQEIEDKNEIENSKRFGEEILLETLERYKEDSPDKIIEAINSRFEKETGDIEIQDDITCIAIQHR